MARNTRSRKSAAGQDAGVGTSKRQFKPVRTHSCHTRQRPLRAPLIFCEASPNFLLSESWHVAVCGRWNHHEDIMRPEGRAFDMCLRLGLPRNDAPGTTIVILTDNMPLALAITSGRASSSHLVQSCRVVCAYSSFCNSAMQARWIASESNPADGPSRQNWPGARATRATCKEELTTQSRVASPQRGFCVAIATHSAGAQGDRLRPLSIGGQRCAGSDPSELRYEHRDFHDVGIFDIASTATRRHARLPPSGRPSTTRSSQDHGSDMGGSHVHVGDEALRASLRSKRRTNPATVTQSSSRLEIARLELRSATSSM